MRMRQSLQKFEEEFTHVARVEVTQGRNLRREAVRRSRERRQQKVKRKGTLRFLCLVLAILVTTVVVTVAMFETLAFLLGG